MVIRVHHLMRKRVLGMCSIAQLVGAELDPQIGRETPRLTFDTALTSNVGRVQITVQLGDFLVEESYDRTCMNVRVRIRELGESERVM